MENDVFVLLLGANTGAYALAFAFAEYGIPVTVMDEKIAPAFPASRFVCETRTVPGITYDGILMRALSDFYEAHAGKSLILLPTTEAYTERVLVNRGVLEKMFLLPNKKWQKAEKKDFFSTGILLAYVGRTGALCTVYAAAAARNEEGEPLALITKETPPALLSSIPTDVPHIALYAVGEHGELAVLGENDAFSPLLAFSSAADLSVAEWILTDYVTCDPIPTDGDTPRGLFTLFPLRKTKPYLLPEYRTPTFALARRGLSVALFSGKGETKHPCRRLILNRFYRETWQKKTKAKK